MSRYVRNPPSPDQIRAERIRAKTSVPVAASLVGVTPMTWERYEAGTTRMHPSHLELFRIKTMLLHQTAAHAAKKLREESNRAQLLSAAAVLRELVAQLPARVRYSQEFSSRYHGALAQLSHFDTVLNGITPPPLQLSHPPGHKELNDDDQPDPESERRRAAG